MVFIKSYEISPQYKVSMAVESSVIKNTVSIKITVSDGKVEQVYIKSKSKYGHYFSGYNNVLRHSNMLDPLYFGHLLCFTISSDMPSKYVEFQNLGPF
jgi:hypothetical protein